MVAEVLSGRSPTAAAASTGRAARPHRAGPRRARRPPRPGPVPLHATGSCPDRGDAALAEVSEEYDFWLTASYMSRLAPRAAALGVPVLVPDPLRPRPGALAPEAGPRCSARCLRGDRRGHLRRRAGTRRRAVAAGAGSGPPATACSRVPPGRNRRLRADLGRPGAPGPDDAAGRGPRRPGAALDAGRARASGGTRCRSAAPPEAATTALPQRRLLAPGRHRRRPRARRRGQPGLAAAPTRPSLRAWASARFPWLARDPKDLAFLDGYDACWRTPSTPATGSAGCGHREADVLFPPIDVARLIPAAERANRDRAPSAASSRPGSGTPSGSWRWSSGSASCVRSGRLPGWRCTSSAAARTPSCPTWRRCGRPRPGCRSSSTPNAPAAEVAELLSTRLDLLVGHRLRRERRAARGRPSTSG